MRVQGFRVLFDLGDPCAEEVVVGVGGPTCGGGAGAGAAGRSWALVLVVLLAVLL